MNVHSVSAYETSIDHPHLIHSDVVGGDTIQISDNVVDSHFLHIWVPKSPVLTPSSSTPLYIIQ